MEMDFEWRRKQPVVVRTVVAGLLGAAAFVVAQKAKGFPLDIAGFIGNQVVEQGGYAAGLAIPIGWAVHLGVALTYASAFSMLVSCRFLHGARFGPRTAGLLLIPTLGYLTTMIAAPAIAVTISTLSLNGLPEALPALNQGASFALWNHLLFFAVCYVVLFAPIGSGRLNGGEISAEQATAAC
jgi:hypothetical protein